MGNFAKWVCLALLPLALAQDYCSVCSDHTMCRFKGKGAACGGNSVSGVTEAEAKQIVNLHNAYRAQIANGQESRGKPGPQPPAANMRALRWDDKLAEVAQKWADQCTFQHDRCRNDPRFAVGQNIYWSSGFSTVNWTRAVGSWYDEVKDFSGQSVKNFRLNHNTGHYTQLAWAETTLIGCARTTYGGAYRVQGYRPREFVLSATPETNSENGAANRRVKKQSDPGFFGGASYDPSGAQGAITGPSGSSSGTVANPPGRPSGGNRPSSPPMGNFPDNVNGGFDSGNNGNRPSFPIIGNKPNFPGSEFIPNFPGSGNQPNFPGSEYIPNFPGSGYQQNYPSYASFPQYFGAASNAYYYPTSGGYYSGGYYQSLPIYQQSGVPYYYIPAGFASYFSGATNTPESLGFFDGDKETGRPGRPVETKPVQLQLPTYAEWENAQINGKPETVNTEKEQISSHEWSGNEWVPTNYDFVGRDQILICNYGSAGNYLGQAIYAEGEACSSCPPGTTCQNGLCADS